MCSNSLCAGERSILGLKLDEEVERAEIKTIRKKADVKAKQKCQRESLVLNWAEWENHSGSVQLKHNIELHLAGRTCEAE